MSPEENQKMGEAIIGENSADTDVVAGESVSVEPKSEVIEPVIVDKINWSELKVSGKKNIIKKYNPDWWQLIILFWVKGG